MAVRPRALLVTGPAGSGKSTLVRAVAERLGWRYLGEDGYWTANGWGSGLRGPAQERIVQQQVASDLLPACASRGAVLEMILYSLPPNPLTSYQEVLTRHEIAYETVVLRPGVEEILRRMQRRGRPGDADVGLRRAEAEWQTALLGEDHIDPRWTLDPTGREVEDLADECLARLRQAGWSDDECAGGTS